ncbi:3-hydroxyacyl-CoA dehydrogenase family protein [Halovenus salina]|uniref:3-hydroxyacyl-CoA dehydrogenase family protein n=1 Tax=Halovenus salina TaxID=1510225 RepID=A0ABD5W5D2_9EURY
MDYRSRHAGKCLCSSRTGARSRRDSDGRRGRCRRDGGRYCVQTALSGEIGPLERADRLGLAERHDALQSLAGRLGPRFEPPPLLTALVEAGKTGLDAGEGFYVWEDETPQHSALTDPTATDEHHRDLVG